MTREQAEGILAELKEHAATALLRYRRHAGGIVLVPPDEREPLVVLPLGPILGSDADRAAGFATLRAAIRARGVVGVLLVAEVWVGGRPKVVGGDMPGLGGPLPPSKDPERGEAVTMMWVFRVDGEPRVWAGKWLQPFHRTPGGQIVLDEAWEDRLRGEAGERIERHFVGLVADGDDAWPPA